MTCFWTFNIIQYSEQITGNWMRFCPQLEEWEGSQLFGCYLHSS